MILTFFKGLLRELWLLVKDPGTLVYNIPFEVALDTSIDANELKRCAEA